MERDSERARDRDTIEIDRERRKSEGVIFNFLLLVFRDSAIPRFPLEISKKKFLTLFANCQKTDN